MGRAHDGFCAWEWSKKHGGQDCPLNIHMIVAEANVNTMVIQQKKDQPWKVMINELLLEGLVHEMYSTRVMMENVKGMED